ncbi:MAG: nucleotidyltransferase domain-containing protein [Mycobacterium sp.]|nr:nucleotidyltransferase domain-containing protein [Mycobacterium sp.]
MSSLAPSQPSQVLRAAISAQRARIDDVLRRYGASNPRLFGSLARGDATARSDIDLLVDLDERGGNPLMRLAGISEELTVLLGVQVDVAAEALLRDGVSATARRDLVPL